MNHIADPFHQRDEAMIASLQSILLSPERERIQQLEHRLEKRHDEHQVEVESLKEWIRGLLVQQERLQKTLRQSQEQLIDLQTEVEDMPVDRLRQLCLSMVERHPALVFDILRPQQQQPGGYHPQPSGTNPPTWCVCTKCREMPTQMEKQCCGKERCITLLAVSFH